MVCILLAGGVAAFLALAGFAILHWAEKPRDPAHRHKWHLLKQIHLMDPNQSSETPVGTKFILRCSGCGVLTEQKF
jgi:hypothetical protein